MDYENLSDFIARLEDDGDLVRIAAEVDPCLEIAEIVDRLCKSPGGGPAVLFENVQGHRLPVAMNLLGSQRRLCCALRARSFDEVAARLAGLMQPELPAGLLESLKLIPHFTVLTKLPPRTVKTGDSQQVIKMGRDVNLGELPVPQFWPEERRPMITRGQLYTKHPETGIRHVGLYPLEVRDRSSLLVHWTEHDESWRHFHEYQRQKRQMAVAVALGGDPLYPFMASAPLPENTDECLLGGFLRGRPVELVKCRSIELEVPADAEIILEGTIDTEAELQDAGPVASRTGFYAEPQPVPAMQVTALTHRANPLFPAALIGRPPMEDYWIGKAVERVFLPFVKLVLPELVDFHMPRPGAFRNLLFASMRKDYPQQARKLMHALWSLGGLMSTKIIVVVDDGVDVHDEESVWLHVGANVHPGRDVLFCEGPTYMNDHAAPVRGMGHKMGIDATRKLPAEGHPRPWPEKLESTDEIRERVTRRWSEYGLPDFG